MDALAQEKLLDSLRDSLFTYRAKCRRVIDGDTLELDIDLGMAVSIVKKVRLRGIDTPEVYGVKKDSEEYKAGKKASEFVKEALFEDGESKTLWICTHKDKEGKYGRYIVEVWLDVDDQFVSLNTLLVDKELAVEKDY